MLEEIAPARIYADSTTKYVIVELLTPEGERKTVLRAHEEAKYHKDLLVKLTYELRDLPEVFMRCRGGGHLVLSRAGKQLIIQGVSQDFGAEPDRELTAKLIAEIYPDFEISGD